MEDLADKILGPIDSEDMGEDPFETVAGEFAEGFKANDKKIMAKALKAFVSMQGALPETDD